MTIISRNMRQKEIKMMRLITNLLRKVTKIEKKKRKLKTKNTMITNLEKT